MIYYRKTLFGIGPKLTAVQVDHDESETLTVHGEEADDLCYSLCFIHNSTENIVPDQFDEFLAKALEKKEYLVHKLFRDQKSTEAAIH